LIEFRRRKKMTTLPLRASDLLNAPHIWSGFARVGAFIVTVLDVFAEAELRAMAAHRRLSPR
jgi:hypothetical protein